ncbi:DUF1642 domain-containing protein [Listeria monocytogenes]|uniref:DUF1642 domain-containing protein n=1 Tax=Listeria seeligeri TaxID=1640 RepID=UPI001361A991|nr:DUF1642 domain-containing protein [Listeria seeligeri]ECQ2355714.1 DUF1642 domain-containing protein [Listeria monocytogenes]HAA6883791.1 DUF1642 domain-containing protein [Listeria monocytogenes]
MKFKKGDKVQFIREGSMVEGVVKEVKDCSPDMWYLIDDKCKDSWIFGGHLILLTPLPVIPQFVADAIDTFKDEGDSLSVAIDYEVYTDELVKELSLDKTMRGWLWETSNQELFARAWMDGYKVKKEPLYYVRFPLTFWDEDKAELEDIYRYLRLNVTSDETEISGRTTVSEWQKADGWRTQLTEKQIKDIDEAYWGFKVPVEEVDGE